MSLPIRGSATVDTSGHTIFASVENLSIPKSGGSKYSLISSTSPNDQNIAMLFMLDLIILPPLGGLYWMGFHYLRYGEKETALVSVFTFGAMSSFFMTTTHSIFPALIYHDINNFVQKYVKIFASEMAIIPLVLAEFIIITSFVAILIWATRKSKKRTIAQGGF